MGVETVDEVRIDIPNIVRYINDFINELEVWEDKNNNTKHKMEIHKALTRFIKDSNKDNAFLVYRVFFEAYWIGTQGSNNVFHELVEKMRLFEEHAGVLIPKQRDHYVHSVHVFLLGLAIYSQSIKFRMDFDGTIKTSGYKDYYTTDNEEFFYRWGIAALFHDIAYPIEITIKQINTYIDFIDNVKQPSNLGVKMVIDNISNFNYLPQIMPLLKFTGEFFSRYPDCHQLRLIDSLELLAHILAKTFKIDFDQVKINLHDFAFKMHNESFVDHGYYSALVVLKWYYCLIQESQWNPAYFYFPILDSASAILLHNYYKHGLMKSFNLGKLNCKHHPIAFLLILCDELQDWNRASYGELDRAIESPSGFEVSISSSVLEMKYKFDRGDGSDEYLNKKTQGVSQVLEVNELFSRGIKLH